MKYRKKPNHKLNMMNTEELECELSRVYKFMDKVKEYEKKVFYKIYHKTNQ
jgi:hypothetical protein